ncbi:MAG: ATP-binding protein [Cytophagaceae bacterium]
MKFRYQLILIIFLTGSAISIGINIYRYYATKKVLQSNFKNNLEAIAETKQIRVNDMVIRRTELGNFLTTDFTRKVIDPSNYETIDRVDSLLATKTINTYKEEIGNIKDAWVLNKNGQIIFSTDTARLGVNHYREHYFKTSLKGKTILDGFHFDKDSNLRVILAMPVFLNQEVEGILSLSFIASDFSSLANDYTGLGKTGETVIAKKTDSDYIYISPLRFNPNGILNPVVHPDDPSYAVNKAILNKSDGYCFECHDYRSQKVMAAYRYIPELQWAMVTKIDLEEFNDELAVVQRNLIFLSVLTILLITFVAFLWAVYFSRPLELLTDSINKFKQGNFNERCTIRMNNEMGILAKAFNEMAENIKNNIDQLHHSNEALNKFGYVISHDLKAPVQSCYILAETIKKDYNEKSLTGEGILMLDMLISKCHEIESMINDILTSARTGKQSQEKVWIDSKSVILSTVETLRIPEHIQLQFAGNLPIIYYNKTALMQVFQNLISNAVKYNDKPKGFIKIGSEELTDKYVFYISDNGRGIKEENFNKIFTIFKAQDPTKMNESSGIGLSIVKKIITENSGEVWVESKVNEGSSFYFTIPK